MVNTLEKKEGVLFQGLQKKYPCLKKYKLSRTNRNIYKHLLLFNSDPNYLVAALVLNPFGKTPKISALSRTCGERLSEILRDLNYLHQSGANDNALFRNFEKYKDTVVLFLVTYMAFFENATEKRKAKRLMTRRKIKFALKLLEKLDISEMRTQLEDKFFAVLNPRIYDNYKSLLRLTKVKFAKQQSQITREIKKMLRKAKIKAEIQARIKTVYSIHNKIIEKNILLSQVLDTIGLRIIVNSEEDCYRAMVLILKKSPVMTSLVKDFIAIPKENGYQSIHVTIFWDDHPVEIQIRTHKMHYEAQYGKASHFAYKNPKTLV